MTNHGAEPGVRGEWWPPRGRAVVANGYCVCRIRAQLGRLTALPPGLTLDLLRKYGDLARALIATGRDTVGTQAARLRLIGEAVELCK
jgi:hypothetical protein